MNRWGWLAGVLAIAVVAVMSGVASAERVPTMRNQGTRNPGSRGDITVPYLTTGYTTIMPGAVAPRIYSSPIVSDPANPQARSVYNLIFYGARQAVGDRSTGAVLRER
jgi:hypothetical protein